MTYESVVKHLTRYRELADELEELRQRMTGVKAIRYDRETGGTGGPRVNLLDVYIEKADKTEEEMAGIESFIDDNFHGLPRLMIRDRYIHGKTTRRIAYERCYSVTSVNRIIRQAIEDITD